MLKINELDTDCAGTVVTKGESCYVLHSNSFISLKSTL